MRVLSVLVIASLFLPLGLAQGHEHGEGGPIVIATDLNDEGLALVGHPAHFNVIAFGDDDEPDFHQDLPVRVFNNGRVVFQTGNVAGHDYDGVQAFDIAFMEPGTWRVEALQGDEVVAHRNGTVEAIPTDAAPATMHLDVRSSASGAGSGGAIVVDAGVMQNGSVVPHVDVIVDIHDADGRLVFRTHAHTHTEIPRISVVPDAAGTYTVRATGFVAFPTEGGPRFEPVVTVDTVQFNRDPLPFGPPASSAPPQAMNAVVRGVAGELQLVGTYDPWTQVGSDTIQRLSATVVGSNGMPVQHVDFSAELRGPDGLVFRSQDLHEYDGSFEVALKQAKHGLYELTIQASYGQWSDEITMPYAVVPVGAGTKTGDQLFRLEAEAQQFNLSTIRVEGKDTAGNAFAHGEIDVDLRTPDGLPLLLTKVHTHGDGVFSFDYAPPVAGDLLLGMTPFPLEAGRLLDYHGEHVGQPVSSLLTVAAAPPTTDAVDTVRSDERDMPAPAIALLVVALLVLARRR